MASNSPYVLLDTNVILYAVIESPLTAFFEPYAQGKVSLVSFQAVAEIGFIGLRRNWGLRRLRRLEEILSRMVGVGSNEAITYRWARLMYDQMRTGSRIEVADAWIAATALVYGCPILTNDRKDFERIPGLDLLPA